MAPLSLSHTHMHKRTHTHSRTHWSPRAERPRRCWQPLATLPPGCRLTHQPRPTACMYARSAKCAGTLQEKKKITGSGRTNPPTDPHMPRRTTGRAALLIARSNWSTPLLCTHATETQGPKGHPQRPACRSW